MLGSGFGPVGRKTFGSYMLEPRSNRGQGPSDLGIL